MIRIMLVDDHPTMLWGLERLIESQPGMQVVGTASQPQQALELARRCMPDVIVLDLDLGGSSSLEIVPALSANGVSRVLMLSASREETMLDQAVLRGARGVLDKAVGPSQVLKAIEKIHRGELWLDQEQLGRVFGRMLSPVTARAPAHDPLSDLTARERSIVQAIVDEHGAPNKQLAASLFISEHTLRNHLSSIYQKLGLTNRLELYVWATRNQAGMRPSDQRRPSLA